jgi:hypothetical protein
MVGSFRGSETEPPITTPLTEEQPEFVTGFPLVCLLVGLMVAQFLVSIDRTIISTVSLWSSDTTS